LVTTRRFETLVTALSDAQPRDVQPLVVDMLRSSRAEVRAAACAWMGKHRQAELARWVLFPRMSDQDWRVRAAAFDAVQQMAGATPNAPKADAPLRDTPVDQREPIILGWINAWRTAATRCPRWTTIASCTPTRAGIG
jgi:HEAT repeat protein